MNKRILSVILTLIMLVSLVPAGAIHASAAGMSISENAITVLKQLEGYTKSCNGKGSIFGYGTVCKESDAHNSHTEKEADVALRKELEALSAAVSSFASKNGLSLSQAKHDALVMFSFENGTAWTTGTGDFQTAIKTGARGSEFLSAICWWDKDTEDDDRRMIEANIYLNGSYSTYVPARFIRVQYKTNGGTMPEAEFQYYDTAENPVPDIVPSNGNKLFMGWYSDAQYGHQVTSLTRTRTVYAHWQAPGEVPGTANVAYTLDEENTVRLYQYGQYKDSKGNNKWGFIKLDYTVKGELEIISEYIDTSDVRWALVKTAEKLYLNGERVGKTTQTVNRWIKLGSAEFDDGVSGGTSTNYTTDVTVTVTNTYLRVRAQASATSKELGRVYLGEQLRIVNTHSASNGTLWGQIADEDGDGVCEGWIALVYTNYEDVKEQGKPVTSYNVIATATVVSPINGYVNVRSGAGTDNQIVGALPYQSRVDLYEVTYVNGIQWGRYSGGWFCLAYAEVNGVDLDDYVGNSNVLAYAFTGDLLVNHVYAAAGDTNTIRLRKDFEPENRVITNLTAVDGITWGKISEGWVKVSNEDGSIADVDLDIAKYYTVVDGVTIRTAPAASAQRLNSLVKGVEFNVNDTKQIIVVGETIWGYADKVGEKDPSYNGWVNLASKYVNRGDAPSAEESTGDEYTGLMATIVGADKVNVRIHHATYSKVLGKIARGTTVPILDEVDGWYKLDYDVDNNPKTDSWVVDTYVEVSKATGSTGSGSNGSTGSAAVETGLGIVANTYTGVNVRTAPGTGNAAVGKLLAGSTVEILEVTTYGASKWGRVAQGWICMDYVTMIDNYEILGALTGNTGSNGNNSTSTSEVAIYTGVTTQDVNVRKTTSLNADIVRTIGKGNNITLHEIVTVTDTKVSDPVDNGNSTTTTTTTTTSYWARVNDGYIYNPAGHLILDALDEATYTVTGYDVLNVRSAAGTDNASVYKLKKGDQVTVTRLEIVDGTVWGFIEADSVKRVSYDEEGNTYNEIDWNGYGWISLSYCTKGAVTIQNESANNNNNNNSTTSKPVIGAGSNVGGFVNNSTGYRYTGKVINTNSVNVRATASTTATITTTLSSGAALVIYETTIADNMAWGRCDAGWVYLYYVDLTPVVGGAVDARVVYNENTIAYTDMNCSDVAGTYSRMSVVDIYEIVGKMARTELGWVNTDNLL